MELKNIDVLALKENSFIPKGKTEEIKYYKLVVNSEKFTDFLYLTVKKEDLEYAKTLQGRKNINLTLSVKDYQKGIFQLASE